MKQKNNLIPSYSQKELSTIGSPHTLMVLLEVEEDIYKQVNLSEEVFDAMCKVINKAKLGFRLDVYETLYSMEEIENEEI